MKEFIPKVKIPSSWKSLKSVELRRVIFEYIKKTFLVWRLLMMI